MKPHISPTQLESYCRCGEAYRRRYIEREVIPPGIAQIQGTGVHRGAAVNFRQKIETHADLPVNDIIEAAVAAFEDETRGAYILTPDEAARGATRVLGEAKDETAALADLHAREQAPDYQPIAVEREARIVLPKSTHDLLGFIDLEDDQHRVPDFKTAGKRKSPDEAHASVQLTYYAAAHRLYTGVDPVEVRLDVLVKNKEPVRQVLSSTRGRADYQALVHRVNAVLAGIKSGNFPPATPGAWWCSARFCGYWQTCPYVNSERPTYSIAPAASSAPEASMSQTAPAAGASEGGFSVTATPRHKTYRFQRDRLLTIDPHCRWCGATLTKRTATLDHVVPLAQGGENREENYCLACKKCNGLRADSGLDPKHLTNGATA